MRSFEKVTHAFAYMTVFLSLAVLGILVQPDAADAQVSCRNEQGQSVQVQQITIDPSGDAILNVCGDRNGSPTNDPFNEGHPKLTLFLEAGLYAATLIDPSIHPAAIFTAWTPNNSSFSWRTHYTIADDLGNIISAGAAVPPDNSTPQSAFDTTEPKTVQFEVLADEEIHVFIRDNIVFDNWGGISLRISPVVAGPPFSEAGIDCQRAIGKQTRMLARAVQRQHARCLNREARGNLCDTAARDAEVQIAIDETTVALDNVCTLAEYYELGFGGSSANSIRQDLIQSAVDVAEQLILETYPALYTNKPAP